MNNQRWQSLLIGITCLGLGACSLMARPAQKFASPDQALTALSQAVADRSVAQADALFGSEGDYILHTGDPVIDKKRGQRFVALFSQSHRLEKQTDGRYLLLLGEKEWPFPVPLIQDGDKWRFDSAAGRDEILSRTVGGNELTALEVARTVYLSQRIYASEDRDGDGVPRYAERLISTPGKRDGLYWPVEAGEPLSPLGPAVVAAADEDYSIVPGGEPQPYHGYFYSIFTEPPSASTKEDVLSKPGTYWLIAYPASWGKSGVMTFASNERGWIYEKDLGSVGIVTKDGPISVDDSWTRIE